MASKEVVREVVNTVTVLLKEELKTILINMSKNRKKRRFWVRQWILRRNRLGASDTLLKELALEDKEGYRNLLRMSEEKFNELLLKVQDRIKKQDTVMRQAISPKLKLQVTLRYLATGDSFSTLASVYRVPKNTISNFLLEVCTAIYDALNDFIKSAMRITMRAMATPIQEELDNNLKVRTGMVKVSDGKTRPTPMRLHLSMELLKLQKEEISPVNRNQNQKPSPTDSRVRIVGITRQKVGGLGLSIKGGAEHKLPILISRIFKDQAADQTGELFVGDAIIKVNGELITHCHHDEAVNILRNAGDMVMLTVKHYRAATPFLQKSNKEDRQLDNEGISREQEGEGGWRHNRTGSCSSIDSKTQTQIRWIDIITVPLMMAYVTRYIFGTDKLRPNAFEVRGLNGASTGVVHCDDAAILSQWLKYITDNIMGLTHLQMKLYNRNFPAAERIEYMGWVNEGVLNNNQPWQSYRPRFLTLKGTDVLLFDSPPLNIGDWLECGLVFKVYQSMLRVIKDSENVDERQHCFLIQTSGQESRYFSVETRQELLRIESAWHCSVCAAVMKLGSKTFNVTTGTGSTTAGLTLDWNLGFALYDTQARTYSWQYKFSQLRGSSDDGKSRLKLHFQDAETKAIETKELECPTLQGLLFCMHAFLTAKVASVDPAFLSSRTP